MPLEIYLAAVVLGLASMLWAGWRRVSLVEQQVRFLTERDQLREAELTRLRNGKEALPP